MLKSAEYFDGLAYYYYENSKADKTLLFLHGLTGSSVVWSDFVEPLQNDFNILLIDLVGQGKSASPKHIEEYELQKQAQKISLLVNRLQRTSITIVSYSFSCPLALLVRDQLREKVQAQIFVGPYFKQKDIFLLKCLGKILQALWYLLVPDKKSNLEYEKIENYEKPTFSDNRYTLKCNNTKDLVGLAAAFLSCPRIILAEDLLIPTLVMRGEKDNSIKPKIKDLFQRSYFVEDVEVKGKSHLFIKTQAQILINHWQIFLKQIQ